VEDILWKAAARALHRAQLTPGAHEAIEGLEQVNKVISVDQTPLGSTPNSTPATYSGAFDLIRELFAKLPEAKVRGYSSRRFSFNQPGGRCEACEGAGQKRIEMHFLPDVWITCDACGGSRYTAETLAVAFHGKTTDAHRCRRLSSCECAETPNLEDARRRDWVTSHSDKRHRFGGSRRVKLAAELSRPDTGKTVYPRRATTGLHFDDVRKLLGVIHRLADLGNTVVVIEAVEVIRRPTGSSTWAGPARGWRLGRGGNPRADRQDRAKHQKVPSRCSQLARGNPEISSPDTDARKSKNAGNEPIRQIGSKINQPRTTAALKKKPAAGDSISRSIRSVESQTTSRRPGRAPGRLTDDGTLATAPPVGRPARWDGRILEQIVGRIEELQETETRFAPTDWSQRRRKISSADKAESRSRSFMRQHRMGHHAVLCPQTDIFPKISQSPQLVPFHEMERPSCVITRGEVHQPKPFKLDRAHAVGEIETPRRVSQERVKAFSHGNSASSEAMT
jgi:excinuclease ABC subunit A